jgi:hypothetical protein
MARSLSLAFNEPTVVGAFTTSNPNEMFVLVLTVKPEAETRQIAGKK